MGVSYYNTQGEHSCGVPVMLHTIYFCAVSGVWHFFLVTLRPFVLELLILILIRVRINESIFGVRRGLGILDGYICERLEVVVARARHASLRARPETWGTRGSRERRARDAVAHQAGTARSSRRSAAGSERGRGGPGDAVRGRSGHGVSRGKRRAVAPAGPRAGECECVHRERRPSKPLESKRRLRRSSSQRAHGASLQARGHGTTPGRRDTRLRVTRPTRAQRPADSRACLRVWHVAG
ncbi:hypothetical protein FB451DRAFT_1171000 [Mycena latifolia]|nr:hypothetical protein FB451DRAFT_1171000 [Mycena latifolia]